MKKIFKKAGIEKKDLLDKDFAPVLFEKIMLELNKEAEMAAPEMNSNPQPENKSNITAAVIFFQNFYISFYLLIDRKQECTSSSQYQYPSSSIVKYSKTSPNQFGSPSTNKCTADATTKHRRRSNKQFF